MKKYLASWAVILLMVGALPAVARAQDDAPQGSPSQPVKLQPGVARVSFIHGDVSSQRGDNGDWVAATLNTPVVEGDRVATGQKSHAELQLDWADILRMSDSATAKVANLSRTNIQVQVGQGLVTYTVLKGSEANSEIDTPNASIRPDGPGVYRILVNSDAETQVVVRQGSADVSTPQGSTHVDKGQMITVAGTDNPEYQTASAPGKDDWDSWNDDRNHRINSAESRRKTNHYYTGSEDLDAYGVWTEVPDYGPVWVPAAGPGWAPYHYGRWFVYGGNWAWWPGPVVAYPAYYPVWAPAYVSFFGFGGGGWGVSFGLGFGGYGRYGWLPCGPGDWYRPWYGRWGNRVNVVNITNIHNTTIVNNYHDGFGPLAGNRRNRFSNLDEAFHNDRVRGGISSMAGNEFGRAAVSPHQERISEASFRQAGLMSGKMPVTPSRESFSPSGRAANPSAIHNAPPNTQRFFNGGSRPNAAGNPSAQRPFGNPNNTARAQSGFGGNRNFHSFERPSAQAPSQAGPRATSPTVNANRANAPAPVQSSRPGWRTFTPPASAGANRSAQGFEGNRQPAPNNSPRGTFAPPSRQPFQGTPQGSTRTMPSGAQPENRGSWQHYTPPARQSQPQESARGFARPGASTQREFRPPTQAPRGNYSNSNSYSRPPLDMRQPIVRPRGGSYGYGAPQGSSSQPRGGYSAPRGGSGAPRGGGNGGGGGGGRSSGGRSGRGGSSGGRQR